MRISGHKTISVFQRYNIVSDQDLKEAVQKLQKFQDASEQLSSISPVSARASSLRLHSSTSTLSGQLNCKVFRFSLAGKPARINLLQIIYCGGRFVRRARL